MPYVATVGKLQQLLLIAITIINVKPKDDFLLTASFVIRFVIRQTTAMVVVVSSAEAVRLSATFRATLKLSGTQCDA
jgi:hypothetical protein